MAVRLASLYLWPAANASQTCPSSISPSPIITYVLRRLGDAGDAGRDLGVALSEAFVVDMDDGMRELTFGDLAVPREIKRAAAALYDRHSAYIAALAPSSNISVKDMLGTQLAYLAAADALDRSQLADYVQGCARALDERGEEDILDGQIAWPAPLRS